MRTLLKADRVLPDAETELAPGAVLVEDELIAWVGAPDDAPAADATVELPETVLLPGLVNAHSHLDLTHLRGEVAYEGEFAAWLKAIASGRDRPGMEAAARWGIREALARGTTTFGDVVAPANFDALCAAFADTGARARLFVEAIGFNPEVADQVFEKVWKLVEMRQLPAHVDTALSPHAPYSVSRLLLNRAIAMADGHGRPIAIHFAESLEELAFLRHGIGPLRELLKEFGADDPDHEPYGGPRGFLKQLDMKEAPLLLVHGNYLRPRDVPAGAFVVYCPTAHDFFGHPEHPVLELLEEGVRVALGSDSAVSGESVDVLSETQLLGRARSDLQSKAIFRIATDWGARALGLECGRLSPGMLADVAAFAPAGGHEILGRPDARCVLTMVGGTILHREEEQEEAAARS